MATGPSGKTQLRLVPLLALLILGCHAFQKEPVTTLRGRLVLDVEPNPLIAVPVGDDWYELKFDIIMREEGGVGATIEDFTVEAIAFKSVTVHRQVLPAAYITDRGYPARVEAGKYLRFSFVRRWKLPTKLLLSGASARVAARTVDDNGVKGETTVRIAVHVRVIPSVARDPGWWGARRTILVPPVPQVPR